MSTIIADKGNGPEFGPEYWNAGFAAPGEAEEGQGIDLPNDADVAALYPHLRDAPIIRIPFPSFADGRGFSIASRLRDLGYTGKLRAQGHVISDQWRKATGSGFDEVEIDDALATRQPEAQWQQAQRLRYQSQFRRAS
ncbi:DUF934 domain-containing protein [Pontivivens ytuae]|uniref:DUF934 domain-containing protein n=1 Tax=Pontivivens ytuae TaxID=2789856 RepID=A0A7S9LQ69_9RHOB|nr:DUF934 domain-containing protein [Pontivivens ytuae]QPH53281.1 DUF934 domain-containing protein [Pontivivens ytuae]